MTAPRRVSSFAALFGLWSCAAVFGCVLIRGVLVDGAMGPCLDAYARRLGVTALPKSASAAYRNNFCQYTYLPMSNGRIEIFGGSKLSSLQLYRARKILEFYLEDVSCADCPGKDKRVVRNKMGKNKAKLDMPNGAHEQPGAGKSLLGQELYQMETPVEGDSWFMNNNMNHRDAAFEEILHLVHDNGIGIDGAGGKAGALPGYQKQIRAATNNAKPTWLGGKGIWAQNGRSWVNELKKENSLTQEYLASVIDVYYGLWGAYGEGMWGIYAAATRAQIKAKDPNGYALVPKFFSSKLSWMVMLHPSLSGTFSMTFNSNQKYSHKSQYYLHATLLGSNNANIIGNSDDNCMGPNSGTNTLDGVGGTDVVLFQGNCADYSVSCSTNVCIVVDSKSGRDGKTTTKSVEHLAFLDGDYNTSTGKCTKMKSGASVKCWKLIDVKPGGGGGEMNPGPAPATNPVPSPSGVCKDSSKVRFRYKGKLRSCKWLRGRSSRVQNSRTLCGHGSAADMGCMKTCRNCGILKQCWQDADAQHWVSPKLKYKTCQWLSSHRSWKRKLCKPAKEAYHVCRKVCNSC